MAEGNERSGKSYGGGHKGYGDRRPSSRGGNGFKPRGKGGFKPRREGEGFKPRYRDNGEGHTPRRDGDGENGHGGFRKSYGKSGGFHKGSFRKEGERGGFRKEGGFRRDGGFHKDGPRRDGGFRSHEGEAGENPRYQHRDGEHREFRRDNDRRGFRRDGEHGGFRRDNDRRDFRRDDRRDGERREFSAEEKTQYREQKRSEYMSRPRRNSDGTMSFPSQNPYTARRPDEPRMPKGMEWSMLSSDERERLRGLAKEHAENIGLHILAAYALEEKDPQAALEHAKWVARQASRIDFARETLAFIAYRQGNYKLALREFRTAYRMNGFQDYLPFIADCERGVGDPKKAVEIAQSEEGKQLHGAPKVEMFLVYAGALGDLKLWDKAIEIVHTVGRSQGLPGEYRMRAVQAEQYFLEEAGRNGEAEKLDRLLDRLEEQYADEDFDEDSDDVVIDHDLEELTDDSEVLEQLGIDPSEARFAPEPEPEEDESEDASDDEDDDEDTEESGDASADDSDDSGESDDSDESDKSEDATEESNGSEEQSTVDDADSAESDAANGTDDTDADAETDTASDETSVSEEPEQ
ncbi:hypothetical protein EMO92_01995 [Bifidobacterium reuteri]|uniref:Helicase n=1 Tax=Bifidobacterium reuteri TaxID=983706 RepID=A0A5J5EAA2_9BIFI|nr:hypothetical protein [Bifidobacterium reuteri]KAA8826417.1 hypothetical protein EMO92_01995 [Bifidobacterium reuteri]